MKNIYSEVLENDKILQILNRDQKNAIKKFEMDEYKKPILEPTFENLLYDLERNYIEPLRMNESDMFSSFDAFHIIRHLNVTECFASLAHHDICFNWSDDCTKYKDECYKDFMAYLEILKEEVRDEMVYAKIV
jgi:hypothetical protein